MLIKTRTFLGVYLIIIKPSVTLISMISDTSSYCDCESSTFRYEPHGHVITGDLRIVQNRKVRRLLENRPKYGEQNTIDSDLERRILTKAV